FTSPCSLLTYRLLTPLKRYSKHENFKQDIEEIMSSNITITCDCSRTCSIDLGAKEKEYFCPACGKKLIGHIYILSNPAMTGLLKIGVTERTVQERVTELNSTGVPLPFEIEAVFDSANPLEDELKVHQTLKSCRLNNNREFFSLDLKSAVHRITDCLGNPPSYLKNVDIAEDTLDQKAKENSDNYFVSTVTGAKFVKIPSGNFLMGSDKGAEWEKPIHRVIISNSFWMAITPLTIREYVRMMGHSTEDAKNIISSSTFTADDSPRPTQSWQPDRYASTNMMDFKLWGHPIVWISARDAEKFCRSLTLREHRKGNLPHEYQYALPTEAQWEYACRAGTKGEFNGLLKDVGWYLDNSNNNSHPVGQKKPNKWGLFDMHGNVNEWCRDKVKAKLVGNSFEAYTDTYYDGAIDPISEEEGHWIYRGGSWTNKANECRASFRNYRSDNTNHIGFRMIIQRTAL
ncbi:MAG: SUMF1/EgtB/PvdO family nonheme iron enzyme, partial [Puniceicoccales bacterium]